MLSRRDLQNRFKQFAAHYYQSKTDLMRRLATQPQNPDALVIACSDSRIDPAILFNAEPGVFFSVRNIANIVPPHDSGEIGDSTWSTIEFAVCELGVSSIIVLGHSSCGGVQYLLKMMQENTSDTFKFLPNWVSVAATPALESMLHEHQHETDNEIFEVQNIKQSIENLMACSWIKDRLSDNKLSINGFRFNIEKGMLDTVFTTDASE